MDNYKMFAKCLVIDPGSGTIKSGMSNDDQPKYILDPYIGRPLMKRVLPTNEFQTIIGKQGHSSSLFSFEKVIKKGAIQNFDHFKTIVFKIIDELRLKSLRDIPVIIAEPVNSSFSQRKNLCEMFFQDFECNSLFFGCQPVFSLFGLGKTTGCLVEGGEGITQIACVGNGYNVKSSFNRMEFGGEDIDRYLEKLLKKNGCYLNYWTESSTIKNIKENHCNFLDKKEANSLSSGKEVALESDKVILPDGEEIDIGSERHLAPELYFKPELHGLNSKSLPLFVHEAIQSTNIDLCGQFYKNIYLSGGSFNFSNTGSRLLEELKEMTPANAKLGLGNSNGRKEFLSWTGAVTVSFNNDMNNVWLKRKEFDDFGAEGLLSRRDFY